MFSHQRDSGGHFPYERIAAAVFTFNNGENSMSYHRSKYEKETIILTNEADDYYSVYTFNCGLKKKLGYFPRNIRSFAALKMIQVTVVSPSKFKRARCQSD